MDEENVEASDKDEMEELTPQKKREAYSIYVAAIAMIIIVVSFFWHIVSILIKDS